ncbi:hypothetical protein [Puia dinghuensis]|uniref:SxtJ n=1 Tax=Puia dinghuensis TaxID=1792502 RepID=A0A8J2U9L5_9BACT|nr:hypothetical protein [Puia dinghuensis]GGA88527.1 hypothetical protein GCM10011511_09700 [Puia dinghuensis]
MTPRKTETAKTMLAIVVGTLLIYFMTKKVWIIKVSVVIGLIGLLWDGLSKKIEIVWMKLTWLLSLVVPNILLSVIFFVFLTPIAFLSKIFGEKNQLHLKNTSNSLFKETNKDFNKESFERPW